MAKELVVAVTPKTALAKAVPQRLFARLKYTREIPSEDPDSAAPKTVNLPGSRREELQPDGTANFTVGDYADGTRAILQVEFAQGSILWEKEDLTPSAATPAELGVVIPDEVFAATTQRVVPPGDSAVLLRAGRFVKLDDAMLNTSGYRLYVAPIRPHKLPDGSTNPQLAVVRKLLGLTGAGEITTFEAVQLNVAKLAIESINALGLQSARVQSDGAFDISIDVVGDEIAWLWLLLGSTSYAGYHLDPVATQPRTNMVIVLPLAAARAAGGTGAATPISGGGTPEAPNGGRPPLEFDERQLIDHPDKFSDDPGGFCTPFENPHRIVGERQFFTVLRVDQPEIGGQGSLKISRPISLDVAPPIRLTAVSAALTPNDSLRFVSRSSVLTSTSALRVGIAATTGPRQELRATIDRELLRPSFGYWKRWVRDRSKGRELVSADNPIEWEGDPSIYQAASVAGGQVLEWRVRYRSNGYSLGRVAYTLTLAPRQTKRINKITWRRREQASRREVTEVSDALTQVTTRARDYTDAVQSSLSEWAQGQSQSRTTGVAGGLGFALGPVVIGGGAAHGSASSSSSQSGGRRVAASEHQQLRDAIRQYGESTRRLESTVITEVAQEEEVEGVAETLRNINYCHALTVMYHEILRHLRVDTEFAGVRECLFVPFSITPFDVDKALKWREQLKQGMLDRSLRWALDYLDEVDSAWVNSSIPAGPRMDQEINYLTGSIYVQLSIERPREMAPEEQLDTYYQIWTPLAPILGMPVRRIVEKLTSVERDRDNFYQRDVAPTMAARWADRLELQIGGNTISGVDFTLATRYQFGGTVRIDFTAPVTGFARRQLVDFTVRATQPLAVGSVANVKSMALHYYTDHYDLRVQSVQTTADLIDMTTGQPDTGASLHIPTTAWEEQDQRRYIEDAVERLITHLNSNLVYYHKVIWWLMDRDELYMLLDGFIAPYGRRFENGVWVEDTGRSIASIVERDPMAILGNTMVMRVAAGAFLGIDGHESPDAAHRYYYDSQVRTEPLRVSLPTEGLYAQAIMDKCEACEEHHGSTDWVLTNSEPELEALADQLGTRRQAPGDLTPTQLPASIISLQNAPAAPDPTGLAGILQAVTTSDAFRDMAGLAGTQANAMGALTQAASLAQSFGQMAVDFQKSKQGTADAKQKLSNIQKAKSEGLIDDAEAKRQSARALDDQNMTPKPRPITTAEEVEKIANTAGANRADVSVRRPDGEMVEARTLPQNLGNAPATWVDLDSNTASMRTFSPDTNDKSGISRLQATVSNAPPAAKFQWTVNNPNKLRFSHPNAGASDILAGESGVTTASFEVQDANGNSLRIGHVWVGVPKFIVVREYAGAAYASHRGGVANSHLFDTVLSEFHLPAQKDAVLQTAKLVCEYLLRRANVRTIWEIAPFAEVLPKQFQPGEFAESHLSPLEIAGFAPTTRFGGAQSAGLLGITQSTRAGNILPTQGQIEVYPGALDTGVFPEVKLILDEVIRLEGEVAANPGNAALAQELVVVQDLWTEVIGRVIGLTMAHEIHHLLLFDSPGLTSGHTTAPEIDLLSPGSALTFHQWTGVEVPHPRPATFPAQGTYTDRGYNGLIVLGEANQARVDALFPVPPAFPF